MICISTSWVDRRVKHASHGRMKTITVRDVQQRWPEAEQALETEEEIIITRDGKPVARLLPVAEEPASRKLFDPVEHLKWQEQTFGKGVIFDTLSGLQQDRDDRKIL